MNHYICALYFFFSLTLVQAQQNLSEIEEVHWKLLSKEILEDRVKISLSTEIPNGWMVQTEDPSDKTIPLSIWVDKYYASYVELTVLKQIKGERFFNKKFEELFEEKIKFTKGDVEFLIEFTLKKDHPLCEFAFLIEFLQADEWRILPPINQEFEISLY